MLYELSELEEQFLTAIKRFEKIHNRPLEELFTEENALQIKKLFGKKNYKTPETKKLEEFIDKNTLELIKTLFQIPEIHQYLSRYVSHITFTSEHFPKLDIENNKAHYYEHLIYARLPQVLLFRSETISTSKFYLSGTHPGHHLSIQQYLESFTQGSLAIQVNLPTDAHNIKEYVQSLTLKWKSGKQDKLRFLVSPNWKDNHATTIAHIINPDTGTVLLTLFINSWDRNHYTGSIKSVFSNTPSTRYYQDDDDKLYQYLNETFALDKTIKNILKLSEKLPFDEAINNITKEKPFLEPKEKAACFIYSSKNHPDPQYDNINQKNFLTVYDVELDSRIKKIQCIYVTHNPQIPFINASHKLQEEDGDRNCAIYGMQFIIAIIQMLLTKKADDVYQYAEEINQDNTEIKQNAEKKLIQLFTQDIKEFLPCYYTNEGKEKSLEELHLFHREERWRLGNTFFSMQYPPKKEARYVETTDKDNDIITTYLNNNLLHFKTENKRIELNNNRCDQLIL